MHTKSRDHSRQFLRREGGKRQGGEESTIPIFRREHTLTPVTICWVTLAEDTGVGGLVISGLAIHNYIWTGKMYLDPRETADCLLSIWICVNPFPLLRLRLTQRLRRLWSGNHYR